MYREGRKVASGLAVLVWRWIPETRTKLIILLTPSATLKWDSLARE
uniref:Uncharacterized protein n=1 Tax=uncultured alpha proteobacterium EF100_102A06 TaxID=710799 RepID=E0Y2B0_9PROT|nr:hypothetical protein [uncultured alpha proteobacterium EF100_102A06]